MKQRSTPPHWLTVLSVAALLAAGSGCGPATDDDDTVGPGDDDTTDEPEPEPEFPLTVQVLVTADGVPLAGAALLEGGGEVQGVSDEQGGGEVLLEGITPGEVWVIAAAEGYRSVGVLVSFVPDGVIELALESIQTDNGDYEYMPGGVEEGDSTAWCSHCHVTIAEQFGGSAHYESARDPQVHDLFAGTAAAFTDSSGCQAAGGRWLVGTTPGGGNSERCYLGAGLLPDATAGCGEPGQLPCDSPDLGEADQPTVTGACADCHAPAVNEPLGGGHSLLETTGQAWEEGVTCDFCHKVASIDMEAEAGVAGRTVLGRPLEPVTAFLVPWKPVMYGPYLDVLNPYMGGAGSPIFESGQLCAGCHEYRQAAILDGPEAAIDTSRWPSGKLPIHTTWQEWSDSLLAPGTPCPICHMPAFTAQNSADIEMLGQDPGIVAGFFRAPGTVRDHGFYGPIDTLPDGDRLLDTAGSLSLTATSEAGEVVVSATVSNYESGHGLPTGEPLRSAVLVVSARCDGLALAASGGQTITEVGGALAVRQLGATETITGTTVPWPGLPAGLDPTALVVRAVRPSGAFIDYSGFESFGDGTFTAEQKGLPERLPVGEASVASMTADELVLGETLALQPGDVLYLGEVLVLPDEGASSRMLAGAPGADFARVLADAAGNTMVPHYRASDVVRDNRVLPYGSATSEHRFTAPATCTQLEAEARLIYRAYPPALARERGWPSLDYLIASREVVVE
jgi:hypothetical protein